MMFNFQKMTSRENVPWDREVKYGSPPFSFYRKNWKLPPQEPIQVIVSLDRSDNRNKSQKTVNINNLIQLFPLKSLSRSVRYRFNDSCKNNSERSIPFPFPRSRYAPMLPRKSKKQDTEPLSKIEQEFYDQVFQWIPYPYECIPFSEFY